jgi:DNA-directed RNA polymerase alpha subunit
MEKTIRVECPVYITIDKIIENMSLSDLRELLFKAGMYFQDKQKEAENKVGIKIKDTCTSNRIKQFCNRNNIFTVEELSTYSAKDLKRYRGVGDSIINEMREYINGYGFYFIDFC